NFKAQLITSILKNIEKIGDRKLILKWKSIVYSHINNNIMEPESSLNRSWGGQEQMNMNNNSMFNNSYGQFMNVNNSGQGYTMRNTGNNMNMNIHNMNNSMHKNSSEFDNSYSS